MRLLVVLLLCFPLTTHAHEIQSVTQHVNLRKQKTSGWQQDLLARVEVNDKVNVGGQVTYLERFELFEKRLGGLVSYRPTDKWSLEAQYLQGKGNEVLPEKQTILSAYYAWMSGFSPYLYYRDSRYSRTTLHTVNAGMEIEKLPGIIFIPSIMLGKASFDSPEETRDVHNFGVRAIYYQEKKFGVSLFAYKGKEASQGIIGASSEMVDTLTGGGSFTWYFTGNFKGELAFDHTDYDQLKTEFHTTTLNLSWMF